MLWTFRKLNQLDCQYDIYSILKTRFIFNITCVVLMIYISFVLMYSCRNNCIITIPLLKILQCLSFYTPCQIKSEGYHRKMCLWENMCSRSQALQQLSFEHPDIILSLPFSNFGCGYCHKKYPRHWQWHWFCVAYVYHI